VFNSFSGESEVLAEYGICFFNAEMGPQATHEALGTPVTSFAS
jgi:hypothetical protein